MGENDLFNYSLQGLPGSISAGRSHALHCVAEGSRPAADITWWKDGKVFILFIYKRYHLMER